MKKLIFTFLTFFATICFPAQVEMPVIQRLEVGEVGQIIVVKDGKFEWAYNE